MTATNHALTGAVIGLTVHQPLLAIPLALLSHFVLDALPHFGSARLEPGRRLFVYYLAADAGVCAALVVGLFSLQMPYWWLGALCAFVAASPDFMWAREFVAAQARTAIPKRRDWLRKFHSKIQWFQKEPGLFVEVVWAGLMVLVLAKIAVI